MLGEELYFWAGTYLCVAKSDILSSLLAMLGEELYFWAGNYLCVGKSNILNSLLVMLGQELLFLGWYLPLCSKV